MTQRPKEWIYGWHAVHALLTHRVEDLVSLFIDEKRKDRRVQEMLALAEEKGISVLRSLPKDASLQELKHQGVFAKAYAKKHKSAEAFLEERATDQTKPFRALLLEELQDPHNVGACLRSAAFFQVDAVFMTERQSAPLTATVRKMAAGAVESLECISIGNTARFLDIIKSYNIWVLGTDAEAELSLGDYQMPERTLIVMGSEAKGLRRLTKEHCDVLLTIPGGGMESLNVSVATGIMLYSGRILKA
jgi:23S rRNA (guanosine2251-2'-O)-methyltransferase